MAFSKKPLKWTALGQEPSELKKSEGFKMDESPAPGHFDFMFRSTYEAIEELQQKAGEVKTVNNIQPDINGNVLIPLPDVSKFYQKPTSGIPKTDLDATVQASLKKADDAAPLTELAKTNQALTTHQADLVSHGIYGVATGTNALVMTDSKVTSYVDGMLVAFKNTTASTASTTLNINSLGAKAIVKANGTAINNLKANAIYQLRYNGTNFILLGEGGEYGTATANDVLKGKTFGTESGLVNGLATITSLGGKRWANGTATSINTHIIIRNLPFTPTLVFARSKNYDENSSAYLALYCSLPNLSINRVTNSSGGYTGRQITIFNDGFDIFVYETGEYEWIAYE